MTQPTAPPPDCGAVRAAVEGLLRTCVDLERQADEMARQSRERVGGVVNALAAVRLPRHVLDVAELAQQVDGHGRHLDADLVRRLDEARQPLVTEIHALLAVLAPLHGFSALPALVPSPPHAELSERFPPGFARTYVADLLDSVDPGVTLDRQTTHGVPVRSQDTSDAAKIRVADEMPEHLREEGLRMLRDDTCHAVERHGHHIAPETQLARLLWLKDPAGQAAWQLLPNGGADSDHWCGSASGGFTSPAALAKPLSAFIQWAHDHAGGVNELIKKHTPSKAKRFGVHVSAELADLVAGDAAGYRGTATTNKGRIVDWLAARMWTITNGGPPMYGVPYDPLAEGRDPGATLAFKRVGKESWHLVTCFPVDHQNPENERLEDLT